MSNLASPPLYFIVIGIPQALLSPAAAVIFVRVLQAILSTATCYFAYRLALLLTKRESAGLLAAGVLAISPVFIIEAAQILTETLYIFLIAGGVWLYLEYVVVEAWRAMPLHETPYRPIAWLLLAALLFGLATLTRAVLLASPSRWRSICCWCAAGAGAGNGRRCFCWPYALVVSTWTVYSLARWNRFVIAGEGLSANLYLGATLGAGRARSRSIKICKR